MKNSFYFFLQIYSWIISLIYMVFLFVDFPNSFKLVLLIIGVTFLEVLKDVESTNSRSFSEQKMHEMPSISGIDSQVFHSPSLKLSALHVIFYLNGVFIATCFNRGGHHKTPSCTFILRPRLNEFLQRCITQFTMYIWSTTQCHNIINYLDKI
jgi:hypothetical protein